MTVTALITGASGGIGRELAKIHASKGGNLVLVARNKLKLDDLKSELKTRYRVKVHTIGKDLSAINAAAEVYKETSQQKIQVDYLINNAGLGHFGLFAEADWDKDLQMINLNITSLVEFTKLYLKNMLERGAGKILNLSSTAAFQPGPMMAVYCATKAYVLSFSEAISNEVSDKGITVTTLCPGFTQSGFEAAAGMQESSLAKSKKIPTAAAVAEYGYSSMIKGRKVAIQGIRNYIMANAVRFLPRAIILKISRDILDKAN